ncbi:MAG TPA: glycosyltransferase family 4 protein [Stellaceae bacterium]|nr:glycosyltransferase family 4 protein [Stellaceae bacterium]
MRILLLTQFYPPIVGGEERHVRNLGAALAWRGHQVSAATLWVPGADAEEMDGEVRVHRIRGTLQRLPGLFVENERRHAPPFPDPELALGLHRVIAAEQPDIVHAHNWLLASFLPLAPWCQAKLVVTLHDYSLVCAKKNYMRDGAICAGPALARCLPCAARHYGAVKGVATATANLATRFFALHAVDRFIAVSHSVARHTGLADHGAAFEVIPNFVPDDAGRLGGPDDPCLDELPNGPFILFVGDLMHLKGVDVLLDAYAGLDGAPPLVLIGRRCRDTPALLPPNVHLFSMWPHSAIMQAWRRSLFAVAPSVGPEACATVVMEAMASGKPVVATDIGGMPDLIEDGRTGLLVAPDDAAALAGAMRRLLDSPALIAAMGAASLERVEQLKAGAVVSRIERVYREVQRERPVARRAGSGELFGGRQ